MSAGGALQAALASALSTEARLTGIYDGPPALTPVVESMTVTDPPASPAFGACYLVASSATVPGPARTACWLAIPTAVGDSLHRSRECGCSIGAAG